MGPALGSVYTLQFYADMACTVVRRLLTQSASAPTLAEVFASGLRRAWMDCDVDLVSPAHEDALLAGPDIEIQVMLLFPETIDTVRHKFDSAACAKWVRKNLLQLNHLAPMGLEV